MENNTPQSLEKALNEAIRDEYHARAFYTKVIDAFGPVRPFVNIVEAEQRHVDELLPLFHRYNVPVPEDDWPERVQAPASLVEACQAAVEAEIDNAAMYDRLVAAVTDFPDVRATLQRLQAASQDRHLPAFERCVARESNENPGSGRGNGRGFGPGPGRGRGSSRGGSGGGRGRGGGGLGKGRGAGGC